MITLMQEAAARLRATSAPVSSNTRSPYHHWYSCMHIYAAAVLTMPKHHGEEDRNDDGDRNRERGSNVNRESDRDKVGDWNGYRYQG
jgi:hypothetical protein